MSSPMKRNIKRGEHLVIGVEYAVHPYTNLLDRVFVAVSGPGMSEKSSGSFIDGYFLVGKENYTIRSWHISLEETKKWQHRSHTRPVQKCEYCNKENEMIKSVLPYYLVDAEVDLPEGVKDWNGGAEKDLIERIKVRLHTYNGVREGDIEEVSLVTITPTRGTVYSVRYRVRLRVGSISSDIKVEKDDVADSVDDTYDLVGNMMKWENEELDGEGQLRLFAHILNNNLDDKLNGMYGLYASALLNNGLILKEGGKFIPQYQLLSEGRARNE